MNLPESIFAFIDLQGAVLDYLWVIGKPLTVAEIQMGFAGLGGDDLQPVLDALVTAGEVRKLAPASLFGQPRYVAINREGGRRSA